MGIRGRTFRSTQWVAVLILLTTVTSLASAAVTPSRKKELALTAYEKAQQEREALNGRPEKDRTKASYQKVIDAYKRVYFPSPASSKADASIVAVAELLAEEGRHFQDEKLLKEAIAQYEFLQRYPKSQMVDEAHKALADLSAPPPLTPTEVKAEAVAEKKHAAMPTVNGIRYWSTPNYTRVAVDLDDEVKYEAGRIAKPDRIFFDLHGAKLASTLVGKSFEVGDGFLKTVRVAPYQKDVVRIVLDVSDVSDYSAFLLPNPYRLIIDIHGKNRGSALAEKSSEAPVEVADATASETPRPAATKETKAAETHKAEPAKETKAAENPESETKRPETAQKSKSEQGSPEPAVQK